MVSHSVQPGFSFIIIVVEVLAFYIVIVRVGTAKKIIIRRAENKHYQRSTRIVVYCIFVKSLVTIVYDILIDGMHFPCT